MIEAVQLGTLDVVNTSTGPVGNFVPEVKIVGIPFLFRDYDHARRVLDGPIGQDLLTKFPAKGLVALSWTENGFRHMTNNKHPIVKPEDASGLKMRTMENKVHIDGYKAFGIQPTPMLNVQLVGGFHLHHVEFDAQARFLRYFNMAVDDLQRLLGEALAILPNPMSIDCCNFTWSRCSHMSKHG